MVGIVFKVIKSDGVDISQYETVQKMASGKMTGMTWGFTAREQNSTDRQTHPASRAFLSLET